MCLGSSCLATYLVAREPRSPRWNKNFQLQPPSLYHNYSGISLLDHQSCITLIPGFVVVRTGKSIYLGYKHLTLAYANLITIGT